MIKAVGVKSVRMDDVASDLGMSKRTLYEMFGDKEELLSESILYMMEQRQKDIYDKVAGCDNMVEVLLKSIRLLGGMARCVKWSDDWSSTSRSSTQTYMRRCSVPTPSVVSRVCSLHFRSVWSRAISTPISMWS